MRKKTNAISKFTTKERICHRRSSHYTAEEFIGSITQHIPDKNFQLVRYYGWYSNRMHGDRLKAEQAGHEEHLQMKQSAEIEAFDVSAHSMPSCERKAGLSRSNNARSPSRHGS
jgi:hypothetical protein